MQNPDTLKHALKKRETKELQLCSRHSIWWN